METLTTPAGEPVGTTMGGSVSLYASRHPWLVWLVVLAGGALVLEVATRPFAVDPSLAGALAALFAYPLFLVAVRRSWTRIGGMAAAGMVLHGWIMMAGLGVGEAVIAEYLGTAALLSVLVIAASFVVPSLAARGQQRAAPRRTLLEVVWWSVAVLGAPILLEVLATIAAETVRANGLRAYCLTSMEGQSAGAVRASVPLEFIRPTNRESDFEVSRRGRGCVVREREGRVTIVRLVPEYGFPWMLASAARESGGH